MGDIEAGPSRLRLESPARDEKPKSRLRRWLSRAKQEFSRPSLLSTTSDSDLGSSADIFMDPAALTPSRDAMRVFSLRSKKSPRRVSFRRAGSSRYADGADEDDAPVSRVVVDGDFGLVALEDEDDEGGSTRQSTPSVMPHSRRGSGYPHSKSSKGLADMLVAPSWLASTWEGFLYFWDSSFADRSKERSFQKEQYYSQRIIAIGAATFYIILWALYCGLTPLPYRRYDYIAYVGVLGFFSIPVLPMVLMNAPYRHPHLWQLWLTCATWTLPITGVIDFHQCGFFKPNSTCGNDSDFIVFAAAIGQSTLAVLCLGQARAWVVLGFGSFFVTTGALFFGPHSPPALYRDVVYFIIFHAFLIGVNFITERAARQLFELREQLKLQYKATQRAQVMEKKASDLTKRFVSYIFHEVRVPLNTALLSVQNLEGENLFDTFSDDQKEMVHGLTGSLSMMEKVLNDVLSFNRMESGTFTQAKAPFSLHKSMQLITLSHAPPAHMRGITLDSDLDPKIDSLGFCFIGDEMRLRQITSNLLSNSIKFTQTGGVKIVTKLLYVNTSDELQPAVPLDTADGEDITPTPPPRQDSTPGIANGHGAEAEKVDGDVEKGNVETEEKRNNPEPKPVGPEMLRPRTAVVRVEVHDTGVGLRNRDLQDDRLFSPYVQTEIGRRQGGKGTGLGLALVRQIVQLSRGRLGVDSEVGKGTTIWFEIPYGLAEPPAGMDCQDSMELSTSGSGDTAVGSTLSQADTLTNGNSPSSKLSKADKGSALESEIQQDEGAGYTAEQILVSGPPIDKDGLLSTSNALRKTNSRRPSLAQARTRSSNNSRKKTASPMPIVSKEGERGKLQLPPGAAAAEPPSPPTSPPAAADPPQSAPAPDEALNVLVVDDDKLTRMMMARMLKRLGHKVDSAEDGQQALDKIRDAYNSSPDVPPVDVVFLDNQMPRLTGVEVSSAVRELGSTLFIVGCTGNALRSDQEEYLSAGADRILTKPIKQAAVEDSIREARKRLAGETKPKEWAKQPDGTPLL